jgi:hypothetical protein
MTRRSSLQEKYRPGKERRGERRALPFRQGELLFLRLLFFHQDPETNGHRGEETKIEPGTGS